MRMSMTTDAAVSSLNSREKAAVGAVAKIALNYAVLCTLGNPRNTRAKLFDALASVRTERWPLVLAYAAARRIEDPDVQDLLADTGADMTLVPLIVAARAGTNTENVVPA